MKASKVNVSGHALALTIVAAMGLTSFSATFAMADSVEQPPCKDCIKKHDGTNPNLIPKESEAPPLAPERAGRYQAGTANTTLKTGTESTMLQTGTANTMLQVGTQNTTLQTGTANTMIQAGVEHKVEPLNILILMDCSQSMKEGLGGPLSGEHEEKMNAAKTVLEQTMAQIPSDVNIGLRVFGQSFHNDPYLDCQQTALLVPIGSHNRRSIVERIRQVRPFGLTPLTYALREAANDLSQTQGKKQLILISDGAETCGFDPCAEVRRITASGINMKIDIVGLGLKRDFEAKHQLNCIATVSGGKFYDANTAAELIDSIRKSVREAVGDGRVSGKVITKLKPGVMDSLPADLK